MLAVNRIKKNIAVEKMFFFNCIIQRQPYATINLSINSFRGTIFYFNILVNGLSNKFFKNNSNNYPKTITKKIFSNISLFLFVFQDTILEDKFSKRYEIAESAGSYC